MDVTVTRKYKGVKDKNGDIGSVYNFSSTSSGGSAPVGATTIINNYYTPAPEESTIAPIIHICFNFIDLVPFTYICPQDMRFTSQESENGDATLSQDLEILMGQYSVLTITPTALGLVILKGEFAL